jgi:cytochrome c2
VETRGSGGLWSLVAVGALSLLVVVVLFVGIFSSPSQQLAAPTAPHAPTHTHTAHRPPPSPGTTPPPSGSTGSAAALTIIQQRCETCHKLWGAGATIGPDLNQVFAGTVNVVPGGKPLDPTWLAGWITDPQKYMSSAIMPGGLVTGSQLTQVVNYLEGIHSGTTKPPA